PVGDPALHAHPVRRALLPGGGAAGDTGPGLAGRGGGGQVGPTDPTAARVEGPPGTRAEVWPGEAAEGSWVRPTDALTLWQEGRALLHPPNRHALNVLSRVRRTVDAVAWLASPT